MNLASQATSGFVTHKITNNFEISFLQDRERILQQFQRVMGRQLLDLLGS